MKELSRPHVEASSSPQARMAALTRARPWVKRAAMERTRGRGGRRHLAQYWPTAAGFTIAIVLDAPLLNALWTALKTNAAIQSHPPAFFFSPTLAHFANATYAAGYNFPRFFLNSILLSSGAAILVLFISLPSGYAIVRLGLGRRRLLVLTTAVMLVPPITFALPYYLMFEHLGLVDTVPALILADTFVNLPLGLLLVAGFLRDLPVDVEESARVDGCSVLGVLWRVVLPLMMPAVASVAILTFVFSWDDYLFAVTLTASAATPVTVGAADFITSYGIQWGNISAATVMSVLPPLVVGFVSQRYLVRGLTLGAVKG
jgi:multiple sugar transport system permease protein